MYARVVSGKGQPEQFDAALDIIVNGIVPAARQQPGLKDILVLADAEQHTIMTVTLWESEADLRASETSGYLRQQFARVAPVMDGPPTSATYRVQPLP